MVPKKLGVGCGQDSARSGFEVNSEVQQWASVTPIDPGNCASNYETALPSTLHNIVSTVESIAGYRVTPLGLRSRF